MPAKPTRLSSYLEEILQRAAAADRLALTAGAPYRIMAGRRLCRLGRLPLGSDVVRAFHEECLAEAGLDHLQNARHAGYEVTFPAHGGFAAIFQSQGRRCRLHLRRLA